jgi:hypothetical protein
MNKRKESIKFSEMVTLFFMIWGGVLVVNQVVLFHACFTPYCLIAAAPHTFIIAAIITFFLFVAGRQEKQQKPDRGTVVDRPGPLSRPKQKSGGIHKKKAREADPFERRRKTRSRHVDSIFKKYGDEYEKYIGRKFEELGHVVIYNGLIRGYGDRGVDLVVLSTENREVNFVQCKNWQRKALKVEHIEDIYHKLSTYQKTPDFFTIPHTCIIDHLQEKNVDKNEIAQVLTHAAVHYRKYTYRKTLYGATERVVDLAVGEHLKMIKQDIFRYKDMKIVFEKDKKKAQEFSTPYHRKAA